MQQFPGAPMDQPSTAHLSSGNKTIVQHLGQFPNYGELKIGNTMAYIHSFILHSIYTYIISIVCGVFLFSLSRNTSKGSSINYVIADRGGSPQKITVLHRGGLTK